MDRIPRIEGAPAILNQAAGNKEIWAFLDRVHSTLSEDDPRYPYYLTWLAEAASKAARSQLGPDSLENLKQRLEATDPSSEDFNSELSEWISNEITLEKYRLSVVYVLCKVYLELGEIRNAVETLNQYRDEFQDHPLYSVLRGETVVQRGSQSDIDDALESIWRAREEHQDWAEVQKGTASVIEETLERDFTYQGYNSDIPDEPDLLLEKAKESIDKALSEVHDHPEYLFVKGQVQALDSRFDAARQTIREAIENLNPNRPAYNRVLTEYRIELSNVDIQEQEHTLKGETAQAVEQLEELREDYKDASQRFQTQTLQFLGFFTGLIGIVVITAQVAISVDSTAAAIRLILVLIGGLLFAFGGFGFLLPSDDDDDLDTRIFGVLICGAILIITGGLL